jgi:hypothetical protein
MGIVGNMLFTFNTNAGVEGNDSESGGFSLNSENSKTP